MSFLMILKWVAAIATIATGLLGLIAPRQVQGFTGLRIEGGRGVTEVRSIFGGLFIALGAAALISREPATFWMLGIMYLGIAAVRGVSIFIDDSAVQSNWISLVAELVFGVILIL